MAPESDYPHIEKKEGQPARLKKNPRVRVAQIVMDHQQHGWTAKDFCEQYPHLSEPEVQAAFHYYHDHRAEIDEEIRQEVIDVEEARKRASPSPFAERMRAEGRL